MIQTYFAPAHRTDETVLQRQVEKISNSPFLNTLLSMMAGILVILNEDRQIVGLNQTFLEALGIDDPEQALGLRLGESVGCIHAKEMEGGCGTSKSCASCGAVIAMMTSLSENINDEQTCALESQKDGVSSSMSLRVRTSPIVFEGQRLIVVAVKDITREHVRANLERVFYHDINNILMSLLGPSDLLLLEMPGRWDVKQINDAAKRLVQEVSLQRELSLTGSTGFEPERKQVFLSEINKDVEKLLSSHVAAKGVIFRVSQECDDCVLNTDKLLVGRVLANMLINAFEASPEGGLVKFITRRTEDNITWDVWNDSWIPGHIQARIFQRYFSTKIDAGRGLGTFSMKLVGESYLQGAVRFSSSKDEGTVFHFSLPVRL